MGAHRGSRAEFPPRRVRVCVRPCLRARACVDITHASLQNIRFAGTITLLTDGGITADE